MFVVLFNKYVTYSIFYVKCITKVCTKTSTYVLIPAESKSAKYMKTLMIMMTLKSMMTLN